LLTLGRDDALHTAAVVPVGEHIAAVVLGKAQVCEDLSIECFARSFALTAAETRVLQALGQGVAPVEIAQHQGVKLSTVRTQIGAIRDKTGVGSINALVHLVAALPPMVPALRQ
jgi:DNA-binding CsgD family transcriptional regulator